MSRGEELRVELRRRLHAHAGLNQSRRKMRAASHSKAIERSLLLYAAGGLSQGNDFLCQMARLLPGEGYEESGRSGVISPDRFAEKQGQRPSRSE